MKIPSLSVCMCAAAVPFLPMAAAADYDAAAFAAMSVADVSALLADWSLDQIFGAPFAAAGVNGEALLHVTKGELTEAFSGVARMHWNRLFRKLEPIWGDNAVEVHQQNIKESNATPHQGRRQLAAAEEDDIVIAGVSLAGYSGIRVKTAAAMVQLCVWARPPLVPSHRLRMGVHA